MHITSHTQPAGMWQWDDIMGDCASSIGLACFYKCADCGESYKYDYPSKCSRCGSRDFNYVTGDGFWWLYNGNHVLSEVRQD